MSKASSTTYICLIAPRNFFSRNDVLVYRGTPWRQHVGFRAINNAQYPPILVHFCGAMRESPSKVFTTITHTSHPDIRLILFRSFKTPFVVLMECIPWTKGNKTIGQHDDFVVGGVLVHAKGFVGYGSNCGR